MKRRLLWLVAVLALGSALLWTRTPMPRHSVDLAHFPMRFEPTVLGPEAPLGREENGPYLSSDCFLEEGVVTAGSPRRTRLSFYVQSKSQLQLELQARFSEPLEQPVLLSLNGTPWLSCPVTSNWATFRANLPDELVALGRNQITMSLDLGSALQFRKLHIFANKEPQTPPQPGKEEITLPWDANLAVALAPGRSTRLRSQSLIAELRPGAAVMANATLRVSLQGPGQHWQRDLPVTSGPLDLALPTSEGSWSKLQLRAVSQGDPLPGQLGLKLHHPQLEVRASERVAPPSLAGALTPGRPNVIVYLIDTLRPDHLGCYGYKPSPSPALDRFAQDSVLFLDASAQSGWTKPATASIFSSQWPWRHGVQDFADKLATDVPWLPQILQANGYQTAAVVTNRLAGIEFGYDRGYDSFHEIAKDTSEHAHAEAVDWLEHKRSPDRPFFLYVHTIDPHAPYMHSPNYRGRPRAQAEKIDQEPHRLAEEATLMRFLGRGLGELQPRVDRLLADYDREIANNDHSFGLLIEWLKSHHLYDSTLIIVVSDHGEEFLEHGYVGHLNSLYQELLHVPLILKFPAQAGAATRVTETWQQIDLAPTVLHACSIPAPPAFQGLAYRPGALASPARPCLFSVQAGRALAGHRPEDKKAIFCSAHGIRQGDWMYQRVLASRPGQREPEELYDLSRDPRQQNNLSQTDPGRALSLAVPLEALFRQTSQTTPASEESNRKLLELLQSLQYVR